ncbi:lysylphosphatidylglycerol synthase transmembrane domain-containing protein [Ktedonospora formicarum]|uniref:TIGR00374 family protein n=1 Tax=Ktedonospora formicarum TaxID=2778364 RepID=A0A8J3MS67_9CHLR|nr:lysylphosphatidylglycerol synthase transmembrane domain-containing protein [Ktedonospora formicarum]GHO43025.1 TIGR00374 family protein [Ktedonospora formicarum]
MSTHPEHSARGTSSKEVETTDDAQTVLPVAETTAPEITRDQLSLSKRLLNWRTLVPLVVVLVALIFFAQKANINPQAIWEAIRRANLFLFLLAFGIYYLAMGIRVWRWRLLLENVGYTPKKGIKLPGFWKLAEILFISFFANVVVPAKLGDLYRAYLLGQEVPVSGTRSYGTVLAERLLDLTVLLLLFIPALLISLQEHLPPQLQLSLEIVLAAVVLGIAALIVLRLAREPIARLVPTRWRGHYYHFQEGTLGSFRRLPALGGLTVGVWVCEGLRFFFVALSLNLLSGNLTYLLAAAIVAGLAEALLTAVPATGGGLGVVEIGMIPILGLFYHGLDTVNRSTATILLDRTISLFSVLVFGLIVFLFAFGRKTTMQKKATLLKTTDNKPDSE